MINSNTHRFLIGRDLLCPLKFLLSEAGLQLTDPKSGTSAMFPFSDGAGDINFLEDTGPFVASTIVAEPSLPTVLKGDKTANLRPKIAILKPPHASNKPHMSCDTSRHPPRAVKEPRNPRQPRDFTRPRAVPSDVRNIYTPKGPHSSSRQHAAHQRSPQTMPRHRKA